MTSKDSVRTPLLTVVQPDPDCPLHEMEGWFRDGGISARVIRPFDGDTIPGHVEADGLVVFGGDMSSLDDNAHPWLEDVRRLQRSAAVDGVPSLGVCLGGQLLAQAFGGRTAPGDQGLEAGVSDITWLPEAADDLLFGGLPVPYAAGSMHRDAVTELPPGAVLLGTGATYRHQVFRVETQSWGVQFHPETNRLVFAEWALGMKDSSAAAQAALTRGLVDFAQRESTVLEHNRKLVRNFARIVRRASRVKRRQ